VATDIAPTTNSDAEFTVARAAAAAVEQPRMSKPKSPHPIWLVITKFRFKQYERDHINYYY